MNNPLFPQLFQITCYDSGYFPTNLHCKERKNNNTHWQVYGYFLWSYWASSYSLADHTLPLLVFWLLLDHQSPGGTIPWDWEDISSIFGVSWGHTLKTIRKRHIDPIHIDLHSFYKFLCVHFTPRLANLMSQHPSGLPSLHGSQFHPV